MIRVGIVGASGYSGLELLQLLLRHPEVNITKLFGSASSGKQIEDVHPSLRGTFSMAIEEFSRLRLDGLDLLFLALPSGQAMSIVPDALSAECKVIDLGGDFRLSDINVYEKYYGHKHTAWVFVSAAAYGLSEWNWAAIEKARLVANPGCYPTSVLLALLPLLKGGVIESSPIGITSYSGTSGAGKSVTEKMIFTEVSESVRAYKVGNHQHIPEIRQYLEAFSGTAVNFTFVPHLLPVTRGIYTTIHATAKRGIGETEIRHAYQTSYAASPFVRLIAPAIPEMKDVLHSNFLDIGFASENEKLVILSTIDNLGKGAAGQAVQNMNIMFGFSQTEGLLPCFPKK